MSDIKLYNADSLIKLKELEENSIDACVTDPPYELGFMGKYWDKTGIAYNIELWKECLRVLKPGGHLLSFGGSRTYHRMACAIEDAGFEIRDQIMWIYGQGFPKSLNIGKVVDKLRGNKREVVGEKETKDFSHHKGSMMGKETTPNNKTQITTITDTKGSSEWEGWGTALKPAHEPIVLARKPLSEKTIVENVLKWGVGGLAIDNCRIGHNENLAIERNTKKLDTQKKGWGFKGVSRDNSGRFPANVIHNGSEEVVKLFPNSGGAGGSLPKVKITGYGNKIGKGKSEYFGGDRTPFESGEGSAARFFYCAKASAKERNMGCEELEKLERIRQGLAGEHNNTFSKNCHPTVKPLALMKYLVTLISREGQTVLDPFMGSGSTGIVCKELNRNFIGIEKSEEYMKIAECRINNKSSEDKIKTIEEQETLF